MILARDFIVWRDYKGHFVPYLVHALWLQRPVVTVTELKIEDGLDGGRLDLASPDVDPVAESAGATGDGAASG